MRHPDKDEKFFEALYQGLPVIEACRLAEYTRRAVYVWWAQDQAFHSEWLKAKSFALELLEEEADRRGYHGYDEPMFRGKAVHHRRKFSDRLLLARLRALSPELYGERSVPKQAQKTAKVQLVLRDHVGDLDTNVWLNKLIAEKRLEESEIPAHFLRYQRTDDPVEYRDRT